MAHLPRHALALTLALLLVACGPTPIGGVEDPVVEDPVVDDPIDDDPIDDPIDDDPAPPTLTGVRLEPVADGFASPLAVTSAGDGSGRVFVVERSGTVRVVQGGAVQESPYLDVGPLLAERRGENGLLGLAFHPDFADNGRLFLHYVDVDDRNVVAEAHAQPPDATSVDLATVSPLLHATPASAYHQGGQVAFGQDGFLYVALGDGGDPDTARDVGTLHGSLLRIDVDAPESYAVPDDNPLVAVEGARPEIWAYGLRNPWRFSFDAETGDLWIADVGQNAVEELNLERAGDAGGHDYGWPIMEGDRCYEPPEGCDTDGLTLPVLTYAHEDGWGSAVIGGYVYRGEALPGLRGAYVFGDFVSGDLFAAWQTLEGWQADGLLSSPHAISAFGQDDAGELHLVDYAGGGLYRLAPEAP